MENLIVKTFEIDKKAKFYFRNYRFENGDQLSKMTQDKYLTNSSVLNSISLIYSNPILKNKLLKDKSTGFWKKITIQVNLSKEDLNHSLPLNERRLKESYENYIELGYKSLVSKKFGTQNSRKVNKKVLTLLEDISKQFNSKSPALLKSKLDLFIQNDLQIISSKNGDFHNPLDFSNLNISTGAIAYNYLNGNSEQIVTYDLLKHENELSNTFFDSLENLDIESRIKLLKQFLSIIDLVNEK
ncbi:hypothetical protein ACTS9D_11585 [Empedobacter brevis]|uniref:hypothetical protein n=1 Tax=Empedobacter brevis TaxID=247 RepID=UPI002FE2947A